MLGLLRSKQLTIDMDILDLGGLATNIKETHRGLGIFGARERAHVGITSLTWRLLSSTAIWPSNQKVQRVSSSNSIVAYIYVSQSPLSCGGEGNEHYNEGISTLPVDGKAS